MRLVTVSLLLFFFTLGCNYDLPAERQQIPTPQELCQDFILKLGEPDAKCSCTDQSYYCAAKLENYFLWLNCGGGWCDVRLAVGANR